MTLPDEVLACVREWLGDRWTARPLAGDASVRAYFRIGKPDGETVILTYYPEEVRPQLQRFLDAYAAVAPHARIPRLLHSSDLAALQVDVGDRTLYDVLHHDREEGIRLYREAIAMLIPFQRAASDLNAPFTAEFFRRELDMTCEFYVGKLMGADVAPLEPLLKKIADNIAQHPYVICHRDYHGQNLHIQNSVIYMIDYQDLRMGPDTYDLASLLRDRGVARIIGDETELELLDEYARVAGIEQKAALRRRYFETLLQRSIKILGTFSKQPIVRGRMHYLDFIPATLESIDRCIAELPDFAALRDIFPMQFDVGAARERAAGLQES
ncbi:MAG TPA: phosphotransferase [Thermoanaerobaculia bacterium]|nr:phosphotransferase [Thermoanaerobaculia bacterium]